MQSLQKQKGLTFISWLIILAVAGLLFYVGIRITPVYLDHYAVKTILETVKNDPLAARKTKREITNMITRRLDINNIRHVTQEHITIKRTGRKTNVIVAYEERRPIAYNLSVVMTFEESVELSAN